MIPKWAEKCRYVLVHISGGVSTRVTTIDVLYSLDHMSGYVLKGLIPVWSASGNEASQYAFTCIHVNVEPQLRWVVWNVPDTFPIIHQHYILHCHWWSRRGQRFIQDPPISYRLALLTIFPLSTFPLLLCSFLQASYVSAGVSRSVSAWPNSHYDLVFC